ncbi:MAG: hypothetical protein JRJ12_09600 [Deltaproteobacteria bacterium]|nr:hypothetical protein [Deltaproteobacteria bacterium]MBW2072166.1 hypothetical protein [Deltaproteobacteria bacterium]
MRTDASEFETLEDMAAATAAGLDEAAARSAFLLFRDKKFRRLARFKRLSRVEQDRIFNELVVSYIVLVMLVLEAPDLRVGDEFRDYLALLRDKIPEAHLNYMKAVGVEAEHLRQWQQLISMRYDEYARDRFEVRAAAMEIESSEKSLDLDGLAKIQMLVPVQTVAIGCHHHICRGDTRGRDELFKFTLGALSKFYVKIRIGLEGGKVTPLTRARVAMKKVFRK